MYPKVVCLILMASLLCINGQDPEIETIKILQDNSEEFGGISIVPFSSDQKKVVADALKGNTILSLDDLQNFDLAVGFTSANQLLIGEFIWNKSENKLIPSPEKNIIVTDQDYNHNTNSTLDKDSCEVIQGNVECLKNYIKGILKPEQTKKLSVGVERTAIRVQDEIILYTVAFFKN